MKFKILSATQLSISLNKKDFNRRIVYKCFYWYGDKYSVSINEDDSNLLIVLTSGNDLDNREVLIGRLKSDLIDYKTRDIIQSETRNIRELIIAKAFAFEEGFDEDPPGDISDPVGFNPDAN